MSRYNEKSRQRRLFSLLLLASHWERDKPHNAQRLKNRADQLHDHVLDYCDYRSHDHLSQGRRNPCDCRRYPRKYCRHASSLLALRAVQRQSASHYILPCFGADVKDLFTIFLLSNSLMAFLENAWMACPLIASQGELELEETVPMAFLGPSLSYL